MFGKDAYNTVKLLMRKYVKATKENCLFLQENSGNYSILTWAYNYLALILKDSEEFVQNSINEFESYRIDKEPIGLDSERTPYWEIVRDLDLNVLKGYLDYWNLIEELLDTGKTQTEDLNRHFKALKIILNEVLASDCFTERYKGRIEERYICLWDKRLLFEAKQNLAGLSARYNPDTTFSNG